MAKSPGATPSVLKGRPVKARPKSVVAAPAPKTATPDAPRKKYTLIQFAHQVREEGRKVTWTTWKETWITSVMVFFMVVITSVFFIVVDSGLGWVMQLLLNFAGKGA